MIPAYELKWPLTAAEVNGVRMLLENQMMPDEQYPIGRVTSIYFDTRDRRVLEEKLSGAPVKHTYRLRWYQSDSSREPAGAAFLEVKQRRGHMRQKRRVLLPVSGRAVEQLDPHSPEMVEWGQQFQELHCEGPASRRVLWPVVRIDYLRLRFVDRDSLGRCNLDLEITTRSPLSATLARHSAIRLNCGVFEFKGAKPELPPTLRILSRLGLGSGSFSKYAICSRAMSSRSAIPGGLV